MFRQGSEAGKASNRHRFDPSPTVWRFKSRLLPPPGEHVDVTTAMLRSARTAVKACCDAKRSGTGRQHEDTLAPVEVSCMTRAVKGLPGAKVVTQHPYSSATFQISSSTRSRPSKVDLAVVTR